MNQKEGRFYIGIGCILENTRTEKILLLRRSSHLDFAPQIWDDVGGRMRQLETPQETLQREIQEETGINDLEIIKPISISNYYRGEKIAENQMIVITYWCQTSTTEIRLSEEHDQYVWIAPEEALRKISDSNLKEDIQQFIEEKSLLVRNSQK